MALSLESLSYLRSGMGSTSAGNELINAIQNQLVLSPDAMNRLKTCFAEDDVAIHFQNCILGSYALSLRDQFFVQDAFELPISALASVLSNLAGGFHGSVPVSNNSPVNVSMPAGFSSSVTYFGPAQQQVVALSLPAGSAFASSGPGRYFQMFTTGNTDQYAVWYNVSGGSNTDPTPFGFLGIEVTILAGDTAAQVATKTNTALAALANATHSANGAVVTVIPAVIVNQAALPMFSPAAGTYGSTQSVALSSATPGASIYYTTNGVDPTIASSLYSAPISVSASEEIRALAVKSGFSNSDVARAAYIIGGSQVATPTFLPPAGTYSGTQSVAVSSLTAGATFYYTTNGSTPTTGSTLYTGPISVNASETLKVLAVHAGLSNSNVASAAYVINALGPAAVSLGAAATYRILSEAGISTTAGTAITGNIAVSPIAHTAITGFTYTPNLSATFGTATEVSGGVYTPDNLSPTPSNLTTAVSNMGAAYTDAAGRANPDFTNLGSGEIGGLTLQPGLYKWTTGVSISNNVTLNGGPNDVFIMQVSGTLSLATSKQVILTGGLQASNIFWAVSGAVTLGVSSSFSGIVIGSTSIAVQTLASVHGAFYAGTAVTLDDNAISA